MKQLSFAALMVAAMMPAAAYAERAAIDPSVMRGSILSGSDSTGDELPDATYDPGAGGGFINPEDNDGGGGGGGPTMSLTSDVERFTFKWDTPPVATWTSSGADACSNPDGTLYPSFTSDLTKKNGQAQLQQFEGSKTAVFTCQASAAGTGTLSLDLVGEPGQTITFTLNGPNGFTRVRSTDGSHNGGFAPATAVLVRGNVNSIPVTLSSNVPVYCTYSGSGGLLNNGATWTYSPGGNRSDGVASSCGIQTARSGSVYVTKLLARFRVNKIDTARVIDNPNGTGMIFRGPEFVNGAGCSLLIDGVVANVTLDQVLLDGTETAEGLNGIAYLPNFPRYAGHPPASATSRNVPYSLACDDIYGDRTNAAGTQPIHNKIPQLSLNTAGNSIRISPLNLASYRSLDPYLPSHCTVSHDGTNYIDADYAGGSNTWDLGTVVGTEWSFSMSHFPPGSSPTFNVTCTDADGTHTVNQTIAL